MTTIKQVAQAAGVRPATVSYVMNGTGSVSAATRERVLAAANALQYAPSHLAQSLQRRGSRTLGLVLSAERSDERSGVVIRGIADGAATMGYDLLLASRSERGCPQGEATTYAALYRSGRVEGLVLLDVQHDDERIQAARELGIPFVCDGRAGDSSPSVAIDAETGTLEALAHLVVLGHERIGLLSPPLELALAAEQDAAYRTALDEAALPFREEFVVEGGTTAAEGYLAATDLLTLPRRPTAIFAGSAALAFGVMHAAHDLGLAIGHELALIVWDDPPLAAHVIPPLTAVRQPIYQLGRELARLLVDVIEHRNESQEIVLQPQLIVRESCDETGRARERRQPERPRRAGDKATIGG